MREYLSQQKPRASWVVDSFSKNAPPTVCMRLKTRSAETLSGTARPFMRLLSASGKTRWSQIEMIWTAKGKPKQEGH